MRARIYNFLCFFLFSKYFSNFDHNCFSKEAFLAFIVKTFKLKYLSSLFTNNHAELIFLFVYALATFRAIFSHNNLNSLLNINVTLLLHICYSYILIHITPMFYEK